MNTPQCDILCIHCLSCYSFSWKGCFSFNLSWGLFLRATIMLYRTFSLLSFYIQVGPSAPSSQTPLGHAPATVTKRHKVAALHTKWKKNKHSLTNLIQFWSNGGWRGGRYRRSLAPKTWWPQAAINGRFFLPEWTTVFQDFTLHTTWVPKLGAPREEATACHNWWSLWTRR